MVSTFHSCTYAPEFSLLESYIRSVLAQKEILPGMERQLQTWKAVQELSEQEQRLLDILQDAIDSGYVRRVRISKNSC